MCHNNLPARYSTVWVDKWSISLSADMQSHNQRRKASGCSLTIQVIQAIGISPYQYRYERCTSRLCLLICMCWWDVQGKEGGHHIPTTVRINTHGGRDRWKPSFFRQAAQILSHTYSWLNSQPCWLAQSHTPHTCMTATHEYTQTAMPPHHTSKTGNQPAHSLTSCHIYHRSHIVTQWSV